MFAYFCGEFVNSFVLAKMKIPTAGRWLWTRTIGSTIVGEAVDSALFYPLAFYGTRHHPERQAAHASCSRSSSLKVASKSCSRRSPTRSSAALKRAENEDYYDRDTHFTPFTLKV